MRKCIFTSSKYEGSFHICGGRNGEKNYNIFHKTNSANNILTSGSQTLDSQGRKRLKDEKEEVAKKAEKR